ncbi:MAG TPA: hypothetical protein VG410_01155 [Solirubrobacteraceae bacterium]|nr:hypothetical protein [Solirubrobacteraceae bacterium]
MPYTDRFARSRRLAVLLTVAAAFAGAGATTASASTTQVSMFEAGGQLTTDPVDTLAALRVMGVSDIRLFMEWQNIAPSPASRTMPHFQATNPAAYPAAGWAQFDTVIRDAAQVGIGINLDVAGRAPLWAMPKSASTTGQGSLMPNASLFQAFVQAVGTRYSGHYTPTGSTTPLPPVAFWSVWNEPNYVAQLFPQTTGKSKLPNSPHMYRNLVDAAWKGLGAAGHGHDKVIIGELAPRGYPHTQYGGMFPVTFVQSLYCLGSNYRPLTGSTASAEGCPTNAAGSRKFRSQHPGLFNSYGFADHPYMRWYAPNSEQYYTCKTGLCTSLADYGNLTSALDHSLRAYGSGKKYSIWSTEYGYQTSPPKPYYNKKDKAYEVRVATAAMYLNWAEYLSYKNPRIASYDQYLLYDPPSTAANNFDPYASGLLYANGSPKPGYFAFRTPLYLPKTSASHGSSLEVWGGVRAAPFASLDVGGARQTVEIQFAPSRSSTFTTLSTVTIANREGYFDTHVVFPASGTVRLQYTYPATDMLLAPGLTADSRDVSVTIH